MRILVVEDEPTLAAQLVATLQTAGYAVDTAANGRDAGYMGEVETFDAVVLDLGLPMVDGLTVLKRWRALGRTMPVLILTARGDWHEKVAGIDAGAVVFGYAPGGPGHSSAEALHALGVVQVFTDMAELPALLGM